MADLATITKLNAENYELWSYKLKLYLMRENLWDVVDKNVPSLPDVTWSEQNNKAMALIGLSIEDNQLAHIKKLTTAHEYWCALKTYHEKSSLSNRVMLLKKLCKMQLQRNQNMEDHVNEMFNIIDKLSNMGLELHNSIIVALLLASLPPNYGHLISSLETRPEEELTIDLIKEKFFQEFNRKKERESSLERKQCDYCHKVGHVKKNCHALQRKVKTENESSNVTKQQKGIQKGIADMNLQTASQSTKKLKKKNPQQN